MAITEVVDRFSDWALKDPGEYYGGYKEPRVEQWGTAERALSDPVSGAWRGSQFTFRLSDDDRMFREMLASSTARFVNSSTVEVMCTNRTNRAALGRAYTIFNGPIINIEPIEPLSVEITLGDRISEGLLSDQHKSPWRRVGDGGIIAQVSTVADDLDLDTPEPILYGSFKRVPDIDPPSSQGFCFRPIYIGREFIDSTEYHCWLVASHAIKDMPTLRVNGVDKTADEGSEWLMPFHGGWNAHFANPYRDLTSVAYGVPWRYTLVYGLVTDTTAAPEAMTDPDACALGHRELTVAVDGVETVGDSTGTLILDRIQQYKHWLINFVANRGPNSYQSGNWLTNPTYTLADATIGIVDTQSFDDCSARAELRLPVAGADPAGYIGCAAIGARAGERKKVTDYIAEWNRSCSVRFGITRLGRFRICMLAPTQAIKDAAVLYTDKYEILTGQGFGTSILWDALANRIPFKGDYNYATGVEVTTGIAEDADSVTNYGREILGEERIYPMAPGITALNHLAHIEVLRVKDPPRRISILTDIGPDSSSDSLGYRDLGDYILYKHFSSVSDTAGQIRLAQIEKHQILGSRQVRVEAIDCDDMIDYDLPEDA